MAKTTSEIEILLGVVGTDQAEAGINKFQKGALGANLTMKEFSGTTRNAGQAMGAFASAASLLGKSGLADLANGAAAATHAVGGLKDGMEALGSIKAGLAIAGVATLAATWYQFVKAMDAGVDQTQTAMSAASANERLAITIQRVIQLRIEQGQIEQKLGEDLLARTQAAVIARHAGQDDKSFGSTLIGISHDTTAASGPISTGELELQKRQNDYWMKQVGLAKTMKDFDNRYSKPDLALRIQQLNMEISLIQKRVNLSSEEMKLSKPNESLSPQEQADRANKLQDLADEKQSALTAIFQRQIEIQSIQDRTNGVEQFRFQIKKLNDELGTTQEQMGKTFGAGMKSAADGLSNAIIATASCAMKAKDAFKQFAVSFLQDISKMILQQTILAMLTRVVGGIVGAFSAPSAATTAAVQNSIAAGTGLASGGQVRKAASGAQFASTATYSSDFNAVFGEAGRELMTVMAKPRAMSIGGVAAQVGNVGPTRTAVMRADDFERTASNADKPAVVEIRPAPGYEAAIIRQGAEQGLMLVTAQMGRGQNNLTAATKRLVQ